MFKVSHPELNIFRAIKIPFLQEKHREHQIREAILQARLNHPNIVQIIDTERDGDTFFIVMEYIDGQNLRDWLKNEGRFSLPSFYGFAEQICNAIHFAHQHKIIHQDLKPENILINTSGQIKIADFGIARMLEGSYLYPSHVAGTLNYMAPEQIDGKTSFQADLWSLGVVFFEMLTGRIAFDGTTQWEVMNLIKTNPIPGVGEYVPGVPRELEKLILKLLEKDPKKRYRSSEELLKDLQTCAGTSASVPFPGEKKTVAGTSWPCFRGDPARSGSFHPAIKTPLKIKWQYEVGTKILSSPGFSDNKIVFGSNEGTVYCLDAQTGNLIWKYQTGKTIFSSPSIADGAVYIGSYDCNFYVLELRDSQLRWKHTCKGPVSSSPAVTWDAVIFGCYDNSLHCLDKLSGDRKWSFETGGTVESSPLAVRGAAYAGSRDGCLYAIETVHGSRVWGFKADDIIDSSPAFLNGFLYLGSNDGFLYCLNASNGQVRWKFNAGDWITAGPTIYDGTVFFAAMNGRVYALDCETGNKVWMFDTDAPVTASPCLAGDMLAVGTEAGVLFLLDAAHGKVRQQINFGGAIKSSPIVTEELLYLGCSDGRFYCLTHTV